MRVRHGYGIVKDHGSRRQQHTLQADGGKPGEVDTKQQYTTPVSPCTTIDTIKHIYTVFILACVFIVA